MTMHLLFEWFFNFYFFRKWLSDVWKIFRETMQTIKHQHKNWKKFRRTYCNYFEHWIKYCQYDCSFVRLQTKNNLRKDRRRSKDKINFVRNFEIANRSVILRLQDRHFEKFFLRHLYNALAASEWGHHIKINKMIKVDLLWWNEFLSKWNDIRFLKLIKFIAKIYTNVSNKWNMRKYFLINGQIIINIDVFKTFFIKFHQRLQNKHINTKKMIIVKRAFCIWLFSIYACHVIIYGDNYVMVRKLHKISIKNGAMFFLQKIMMMIALNDIFIKSWWIFTYENEFTDAFSQRNFKKIADKYFLLQNVISIPFTTHSSNDIKKSI